MKKPKPVPMLLVCPTCGGRHIDEGKWAKKPHHTHACQHCGHVWRPAIVPTAGVAFLPGFANVGFRDNRTLLDLARADGSKTQKIADFFAEANPILADMKFKKTKQFGLPEATWRKTYSGKPRNYSGIT